MSNHLRDNTMRPPCATCGKYEDMGEEIQKHVSRYVESMNPEDKVSSSEYERRVQICLLCEAQIQGMCQYCGCFVCARAAKNIMNCPHPEKRKW